MTIDIYTRIDDVIERGVEMVEFYRQNPVMAAYDLLHIDLAPIQRLMLIDMWFKNFVISVAGRGAGKTYILAVNAVLHALLYPGYRVGLIAPSFRQSKYIFAEIEKIYSRSPILREAVEKGPTRAADACYLRFKSTDSSNGSYIEALPIGIDGAKIRGSRFYLIQIDELAQMHPTVIDMVIRPMAAVSLEPMQRVRERERQDRLIAEGRAVLADFGEETANKLIMTSSGFFKFNHMWKRMKAYWKAIDENPENNRYAVHQIPYQLLPPAFLDEENIKEAKRTMSNIEFMMEYEAAMVSDSDGFFKASLLESCSVNSNFSVRTSGESGRDYVIGIDPNQGGNALCGIVLLERGDPNKIVYVQGLKSKTTQDMAKAVQSLCNSFNVIRIFMDSQGGGKSVRDFLREGYNKQLPILDMEDKETRSLRGKRILRLVNPTTQWISDANFDTLSLLENKELLFPIAPLTNSSRDENMYEDVRLLKSQMLNIVVSQTARGLRHFDTPKKGQNKDLYSALILAAYGIREISREIEEEEIMLHPSGLIRNHIMNTPFTNVAAVSSNRFNGALLSKKL